jgi:hypothetical protein
MSTIPKIPIRKADGTVEYIDLAEFKKRQAVFAKPNVIAKPLVKQDLTIPELRPAPLVKKNDYNPVSFKKEDADSLLSEPPLTKLPDQVVSLKPRIVMPQKSEISEAGRQKVANVFIEQRSASEEVNDISQLLKNKYPPRENITSTFYVSKNIVRDVSPNVSANVGPVEEIRSYTLPEFRRLSANPMEAIARFKQKFLNLREESFLLFTNALSAWRESPLYMSYINKVVESLNKKVAIQSLLTNSGDMQIKEMEALLQMEKELN